MGRADQRRRRNVRIRPLLSRAIEPGAGTGVMVMSSMPTYVLTAWLELYAIGKK